MTHEMKLSPEPFTMMVSGIKTIELRLFDEKRRHIKPNDRIQFTNTENGTKITVRVIEIHPFNSFAELYAKLPLLKCGYTEQTIQNAKPEDMLEYYSIEQEKLYGVVGIETELIRNI